MRATLALYDRAFTLARLIVGTVAAAVGLLIVLAGPDGLSGPTFRDSSFLPWWSWGTTALAAGLLALWPRTRRVGLLAVAAWYLMWGGVLAVGGLSNPGAAWYPAIIFYGQLAPTALVLFVVDRTRARTDQQ